MGSNPGTLVLYLQYTVLQNAVLGLSVEVPCWKGMQLIERTGPDG